MTDKGAVSEESAAVENGVGNLKLQTKVPATELALVGGEVLLYILDLGRYCIFLYYFGIYLNFEIYFILYLILDISYTIFFKF